MRAQGRNLYGQAGEGGWPHSVPGRWQLLN